MFAPIRFVIKEVEKKDFRSHLGMEPETYRREGIAQKATHKPIMADFLEVR